jgi:hypothetical protein
VCRIVPSKPTAISDLFCEPGIIRIADKALVVTAGLFEGFSSSGVSHHCN